MVQADQYRSALVYLLIVSANTESQNEQIQTIRSILADVNNGLRFRIALDTAFNESSIRVKLDIT